MMMNSSRLGGLAAAAARDSWEEAGEAPPRLSGMAISALVLGVLSLGLTVVAGIPALVLGMIALHRINKHPERFAGKGYAIAGIVTGFIGSFAVVTLLGILLSTRVSAEDLPTTASATAPATSEPATTSRPAGRQEELRRRSMCAANLGGLTKACIVYANENNNAFPTTLGVKRETNRDKAGGGQAEDKGEQYSLWSGAEAPTYASNDIGKIYGNGDDKTTLAYAQANNNPTACLWILALKNYVGPKQLICKSDPFAEKAASPLLDAQGNYYQYPQKPGHISYSISFPWSKADGAPGWRDTSDSSLPLMSDMALRQAAGDGVAAAGKLINSPNHGGDGQNVAYGDAHVDWARNPRCGQNEGESIFHWGGWDKTKKVFGADQKQSSAGIFLAAPESGYDVYMVPQRDAAGKMW